MSDFYRHIEEALVAHFEQQGELADVRTFSAEARELVFAHDELSKRFPGGQLPALQLTTQLLPARSRPSTAHELVYEVPLDVDVIVGGQNRNAARLQARELQRVVERTLHRLRRGSDCEAVWGANYFLTGDVESSLLLVEGAAHFFAIATIEATVEHYQGIDD